MKPTLRIVAGGLLALGLTAVASAQDKVEVVTTLPHLASIAGEIGGERIEVRPLASGRFNPHFISPTPSLMAAARDADLYLEVGMSLEIWSERVIDGSRNPRIRGGQPGHAAVYEGVDRIQIPKVLTRGQGDVHPLGNPHIWVDPLNAKLIAGNVARALERVDPAGKEAYAKNLKAFEARVDRAYFGEALVELLGADLLTRLARSGKLFDFLESKSFRGEKLSDKVGGWL
ncbi:MAG: metal ABC transporter substrate-binding protein, partial [Planctomycetota bacterium]